MDLAGVTQLLFLDFVHKYSCVLPSGTLSVHYCCEFLLVVMGFGEPGDVKEFMPEKANLFVLLIWRVYSAGCNQSNTWID